MSQDARAAESLTRLIADVQETQLPDIDWDEQERLLLSKLAAREVPLPVKARRGAPRVLAAALLAAVVLLAVFGLALRRGSENPSPAREEQVASGEQNSAVRDSGRLSVGHSVEAGFQPMTVRHAGLADWTLMPGSRATLKALKPSVAIALESGSLTAKVVPSRRPESFIVEVGQLRVAVHGTIFSVRREGDRAFVQVSEGTVGVGPLEEPAKQTLLVGPSAGRFYTKGPDAGSVVRAAAKVERSTKHSALVAEGAEPTAEPSAVEVGLRPEPTFEEVDAGLALVHQALSECLAHHTGQSGKVRLSLRTRMMLKVEGDGSLSRYRFSPPLSPEVAVCARARFDEVHFARSQMGTHIIRDLEIDL